jgi:hypothetical protein
MDTFIICAVIVGICYCILRYSILKHYNLKFIAERKAKPNIPKEEPNKSSITIGNKSDQEVLGVLSEIEIKQKVDQLNFDINYLLTNFMHETGRAFISQVDINYGNGGILSTNLKCNITQQNFVMPLSLACNEKYKN